MIEDALPDVADCRKHSIGFLEPSSDSSKDDTLPTDKISEIHPHVRDTVLKANLTSFAVNEA